MGQHAALDRPRLRTPVDPDRQPAVVTDPLPRGVARDECRTGRHELAVHFVADLHRLGRSVQSLDGVHQVMLAYDPRPVVNVGRTDEAGVAVGQLLGSVLVDLLHPPVSRPKPMIVAAAKPAFVVAHAVVDHLRMDLQQVEVDQRRVVLAAADLGFHAVAQAGPVEVIGTLAEQRSVVRIPS